MGKKSTASSGKQQKTSPEETTSNGKRRCYKINLYLKALIIIILPGLTGAFATDFVELLGRQGLPQVEIRNLHKTEYG